MQIKIHKVPKYVSSSEPDQQHCWKVIFVGSLCSSTENTPSPGPYGRPGRQRADEDTKLALVAKFFARKPQAAAAATLHPKQQARKMSIGK